MSSELSISTKPKNVFLSLAGSIAQNWMSLRAVFLGGQTWETAGLGKQGSWSPRSYLMRLLSQNTGKTSIIGNYCISCPESQFSNLVGDLTCLGQKFYNDTAQETEWWGTPNHTEPQPHLLANFSNLWKAWNNLSSNIEIELGPGGVLDLWEASLYSAT
jgi:hypothetical protein